MDTRTVITNVVSTSIQTEISRLEEEVSRLRQALAVLSDNGRVTTPTERIRPLARNANNPPGSVPTAVLAALRGATTPLRVSQILAIVSPPLRGAGLKGVVYQTLYQLREENKVQSIPIPGARIGSRNERLTWALVR